MQECVFVCVRVLLGRCRRAEEADGNVFFCKQERLLNPCLLEQEEEKRAGGGRGAWRCRGFRYIDGLRRFPSFIKRGPPYAP